MAIQILGGSGYQRGVEMAETGINVETFECEYTPEVNEELQGLTGEAFCVAKSTAFSRDVTISGEVSGATGVMAYTLTAACTVANDIATYGTSTGSLLLQSATETQDRKGWRKVSVKLKSRPGLVLA